MHSENPIRLKKDPIMAESINWLERFVGFYDLADWGRIYLFISQRPKQNECAIYISSL